MNETTRELFPIVNNPAYATQPHPSVTAKYGFVPTHEIVGLLEDRGWNVTAMKAAKVRKADYSGYQKHIVRMRHKRARLLNVVGDVFPEIAIVNAHRSGILQIMFALYRLVCTNGMIVADTDGFMSYKRRHLVGAYDDVLEYIEGVVEAVPMLTARVGEFASIQMDVDSVMEFALEAMKIRWPKGSPVSAFEVTRPRRAADTGSDLWTVFNIVQESLIKGGSFGFTKTGKHRMTREITSVEETVRINRELWQLTSDTALKLAV